MKVTSAELCIIQHILQTHIPHCSVWAFGSRVHRQQLKPFSDLDLAVITTEPLSPTLYQHLLDAFSESNLPFKVDIIDWARTKPDFQAIIKDKYEIVQ